MDYKTSSVKAEPTKKNNNSGKTLKREIDWT